ncbi:hypothetical protein AD998_11105 [bacterium 336/3]|nr:hypothetical protein AD998_11105 [bacterium 336/3]
MKILTIILFFLFSLELMAQEQTSKYSSRKINNHHIIIIEDSITCKPEHFSKFWYIRNDSLAMFITYFTKLKYDGLKLNIKRNYILQVFSYYNSNYDKMLDIVLLPKKYFKQHGTVKYPKPFHTVCFAPINFDKIDRFSYFSLNCTNLGLFIDAIWDY